MLRRALASSAAHWLDEFGEWAEGITLGFVLVLLIVCLFSLGCAGAAPDPDGVPSAGNCKLHRCELHVTTFAPAPELSGATLNALQRLGAATGRTDLAIDPGGVPVVYAAGLLSGNLDALGHPILDCARTTIVRFDGGPGYAQKIEVDPTARPDCPDAARSVMHELIHALAPDVEHAPDPSLFAVHIRSARTYDEPALTQLCSEFDCLSFEPERP